jgi:exopolyphosphatase/guanosine-5'-triphosphate,3'-diphosphate pyrophosphatase
MRRAANGRAFAERARREAGLRIEIIGPDREARLAFAGATEGIRGRVAAVDIGGGSTEIMAGREGRLGESASFRIGAVALTENFARSDPPSPGDLESMRAAARKALNRLPPALRRAAASRRLVAIGGTAVNLGGMAARIATDRHIEVHGLTLVRRDLARLEARLTAVPLAARRRLPGLDPKRADIIIAGAVILGEVMAATGAPAVVVSTRGLRHGLIIEAMKSRA